jgi:predicted esterase
MNLLSTLNLLLLARCYPELDQNHQHNNVLNGRPMLLIQGHIDKILMSHAKERCTRRLEHVPARMP